MTKGKLKDLPILPRDLRPLTSINSPSQISSKMMSKLTKPRRKEMKSKKKFPRKKGFKKIKENNF